MKKIRKHLSLIMVLLLVFGLLPFSPGGITARAYVPIISFNANGGSGIMAQQQFDSSGQATLNKNTFTKTGYYFTGWNTQGDGSGSGYEDEATVKIGVPPQVSYNLNLYAQWAEDQITISYTSANSVMGTVSPIEEKVGAYTGTPTPTGSTAAANAGCHFVSWTNASGKVVSTDSKLVPASGDDGIYHAATYTANFVADTNEISADNEDLDFSYTVAGDEPPEAQEITVTNSGNTNLPLPLKLGLTEAADFDVKPQYPSSDIVSPGDTVAISVQPRADLQAGDYDESFTIQDANDKFNTLTVSLHYTVLAKDDAPVKLNDIEAEGTLNAGQNVYYASPADASMSDAEIEYCDMDVWAETATLSDAKAHQHFVADKLQKLNSFIWNNVTYTIWHVFFVDETETCRYIYVMHNPSYTVAFDGNGGNADLTSEKTDEYGYLKSLPPAVRSGYTFNGWYTEAAGGTVSDKNTKYAADTTLYAHWTAADINGGSESGNGSSYTGTTGKWQSDKNGWWYRNSDGTWPNNTWKQIDGKWYHFNSKGYMQKGWILIDGKWYYLNSDGSMAAGLVTADGYNYYFNADGSMAVGDVNIKGVTHHFNDQKPTNPTYVFDEETETYKPIDGNTQIPYGAEITA